MFSLLSTFSLWLGAALVVPLAIHFLGTQRQKKLAFPSLLLVREQFSKSMHRHRLKNILLLLIRTLLILCLLLALANPVFNSSRSQISHPENSLFLVHNGIYGKLPSTKGKNALDAQKQKFYELDSAEEKQTEALPLISNSRGLWEVAERFGDYTEAVNRMVSIVSARPGTAQFYLPVYAWTDILTVKDILLRALKENPGLQIALTDYEETALQTQAFMAAKSIPDHTGPLIKIQATLNPDLALPSQAKVQVFHEGRLFQELTTGSDRVEFTVPLSLTTKTIGKISIDQAKVAVSEYHYCFPKAGEWIMIHTGSGLASLPSLGRETYFRKILHVNGAKEIPWTRVTETRLIYLANDRGVDPATYTKVVEFVKRGGRLIIGVGEASDIPSLNRFLLQPLRMGRLGNLIETSTDHPITLNKSAISTLGQLPKDLGNSGTVRKYFTFLPDSGTEILLSQAQGENREDPSDAILASHRYYRGKIFLWTTDIDNLNWTDLGVQPITPLLHQALQITGLDERVQNFSIASDSILTLSMQEFSNPTAIGLNPLQSNPSEPTPKILDPDLRPFTRLRFDAQKWHIGPFDQIGIYQVILGRDTSSFAVNLASSVLEKGEWKKENQQAKSLILEAFKAYPGRLIVISDQHPPLGQSTARALWPALLLASILLLFLEGLIASAFSLRRSRT
jgi:Aerotolerance regulator N-terminal